MFSETSSCTMVKKLSPNFCLVLNIFTMKKSCRGIKFLFNWKNSPWFSGAYNDWIGLQDFHACSDLISRQSATIKPNVFYLYVRHKSKKKLYTPYDSSAVSRIESLKGIFDSHHIVCWRVPQRSSHVHVLLSRFYLDFIQILSWFYPNFIQIKSG